jgi:hypothetical protein
MLCAWVCCECLPLSSPSLQASKAASAQSKQKLADKLRGEMVEAPAAAAATGGGDMRKVGLATPCGRLAVLCRQNVGKVP